MTERETSAGFLVGGETVQTYNDAHYKKLRERWGLGDDFLRAIERHQHTRDLGIPIADEQSGIVIRLLQRGRCPRFQLRDDIAHSKGLIGLHNSNVREVQNNAYF